MNKRIIVNEKILQDKIFGVGSDDDSGLDEISFDRYIFAFSFI